MYGFRDRRPPGDFPPNPTPEAAKPGKHRPASHGLRSPQTRPPSDQPRGVPSTEAFVLFCFWFNSKPVDQTPARPFLEDHPFSHVRRQDRAGRWDGNGADRGETAHPNESEACSPGGREGGTAGRPAEGLGAPHPPTHPPKTSDLSTEPRNGAGHPRQPSPAQPSPDAGKRPPLPIQKLPPPGAQLAPLSRPASSGPARAALRTPGRRR